jgi:hypothetical protein
MDFRPMIFREAHESQHIGLRFVHQGSDLRHLGTQLIGDRAPLLARGLGVVLDEGSADEGCDDATTLAAGVGEHVAQVHAGSLKKFAAVGSKSGRVRLPLNGAVIYF